MAEAALRAQLFDEHLERYVLIGEGVQDVLLPCWRRRVNGSSSASSLRRTSVLTKKPIRLSVSFWLRPATGVPTTTSAAPLQRLTSSEKAVCRTMNSVAP